MFESSRMLFGLYFNLRGSHILYITGLYVVKVQGQRSVSLMLAARWRFIISYTLVR